MGVVIFTEPIVDMSAIRCGEVARLIGGQLFVVEDVSWPEDLKSPPGVWGWQTVYPRDAAANWCQEVHNCYMESDKGREMAAQGGLYKLAKDLGLYYKGTVKLKDARISLL